MGTDTVTTTGTTTTGTPTTAGTTTNAATAADTIHQTTHRSTCIFEQEASSVWRKLHIGDDQVDLPYDLPYKKMLDKSE
jgi:hypothetical protein